jgi:hypothetical protein
MNRRSFRVLRITLAAVVSLLCCAALSGCLVAGYSSGSGFWVWPGSIVVTLVLLLFWFVMRR